MNRIIKIILAIIVLLVSLILVIKTAGLLLPLMLPVWAYALKMLGVKT